VTSRKKFGRGDRNSRAAELVQDGCYVAAFRSAFNSGALPSVKIHKEDDGIDAQITLLG
jgi:hypothetical protein